MSPSPQPVILMTGSDPALTYLLGRFAERSGYHLVAVKTTPSTGEIYELRPAAVLFASIQTLEAAQTLIADLTGGNIPLLVCSAVADQARAHELGVDACLLHPLTYENFLNTLTALQNQQRITED